MNEGTLSRLNKTKRVMNLIAETCSGTNEMIDECINGERTQERIIEDLLAIVNGIRTELNYVQEFAEHDQTLMRIAKGE